MRAELITAAGAAAGLLFIAWTATAQQKDTAPTASFATSKLARKAVDDKFKKWEVAPLSPEAAACATEGPPPRAIEGDFNSDGTPDAAAALKVSDGVHLVAVLNRVEDAFAIDLDTVGQTTADGFLVLQKRGQKYTNAAGLQDFFAADTITFVRCGQPTVAYLWSGSAFRKSTL
jgi:hypothetical protein